MSQTSDVPGTAALAICEALLSALNDHRILPEQEILGILQDAAAARQNALEHGPSAELHMEVAALITPFWTVATRCVNAERRPLLP